MSQQPLDLRKAIHIVGRWKTLVAVMAAVGLLGGAAYVVLDPPLVTSQALVVLPQGSSGVATQVVIANSDPVLTRALADIRPAVSLATLQNSVQSRSVTSSVISVTAQSDNTAQATAVANAVANSYVHYVGSSNSPVGNVVARVLESATAAGASTSSIKNYLIYGIVGAVIGGIIGAIVSLAFGRHDRRLRERDDIADSIGVPVLASVPVGHPSDPAGWTRLMEQYKPEATHAWRLRKALEAIEAIGGNRHGTSVSILSLSADHGAIALGPLLAVYAASLGTPASLVVGPQEESGPTAALAAACSAQPSQWANRPANFSVRVTDSTHLGDELSDELSPVLTVVVVVVDPASPQLPAAIDTDVTLLGVSAGKTTAEQLAKVAMAAASGGREISGILVADPDSTDRTTGRIPRFVRPVRGKLPTRVELPTESRK